MGVIIPPKLHEIARPKRIAWGAPEAGGMSQRVCWITLRRRTGVAMLDTNADMKRPINIMPSM